MCQYSPMRLSRKQVTIERHLGSGAFADVLHVIAPTMVHHDGDYHHATIAGGSSSRRKHPYALKQLHQNNKDAETKSEQFKSTAASDLMNEVKILTSLPDHDHIIKLRGISDTFWNGPEKGFVLLELMAETLYDSLQRCRYRMSSQLMYGPKTGLFSFKQKKAVKADNACQERLRVRDMALGVAKALQFLHSQKIIFRDVKPHNVGVGFDGKVRLFDFGLARQLATSQSSSQEERKLTGSSGTVRYMAPEVALHENYTYSADVYSFAVMLWEICTLKKPFGNITSNQQMTATKARGVQPPLSSVISPTIKTLLHRCWDQKQEQRPSFTDVVNKLESAGSSMNSSSHSASSERSSSVASSNTNFEKEILTVSSLSSSVHDVETNSTFSCSSIHDDYDDEEEMYA